MNITFFTHKPHRRRRRIVFGTLLGFLALVIAIVLVNLGPLRRIAAESKAGSDAFTHGKAFIEKQDFVKGAAAIREAVVHFENGEQEIHKLNELRLVPMFARQLDAVQTILSIGIKTGKSVGGLADLAEQLSEPILSEGNGNLGALTRSQKGELLQTLDDSDAILTAAQTDIRDAVRLLENLPRHFLVPPVASAAATLRTELPHVEDTIASAAPLLRVLPEILGHPEERRYFFLLQNHNELRPTGGFIGTYGVLELRDGDIDSFTTDNVYNVDKDAPREALSDAPAPLQKYLSANKWFLRDANWSPDFPTAANNILDIYAKESRRSTEFHGVVAITPTLLESLLDLIGPVTVQNTTFTKENAVATLQYLVEIGYTSQGIASEDRKDVIGELSDVMITRLFALPRERWGTLAEVLRSAAEKKDILLFLKNDDAQNLLEKEGWTGTVPDVDGDFLLVIDANLASLKTDEVIHRSISYAVHPVKENGTNRLRASLSVTYTNAGSFDWKTTRYRTYSRMYVPLGSTLVSAKGYLENDKLHGGREGTVDTFAELGKTVFGGFTSIEPGEQRTLELVYDLPTSLYERLKDGSYSFVFEKQPGTRNVRYALDIEGEKRLKSYSTSIEGSMDRTHFRSEGVFQRDAVFSLTY